jgi:cysteine synthase B
MIILEAAMIAIAREAPAPLVRLGRYSPGGSLSAKLEHLFLTGGVFDRIAATQVSGLRSELEGKRAVIAGSGSVCLAYAAAFAGVNADLIAVCPASMLPEHRILLGMHPLELVLSDSAAGIAGAHTRALDEVAKKGGVLVYSPFAEGDAEHLFEERLSGELATVVAAVGAEINLVVPFCSRALIAGARRALVSAGGRPKVIATVAAAFGAEVRQDDLFSVDAAPALEGVEKVVVGDREALAARAEVARSEGLLVGMSSAGALAVARERARSGATVAIVVDAGDRYFSVDREAAAAAARSA